MENSCFENTLSWVARINLTSSFFLSIEIQDLSRQPAKYRSTKSEDTSTNAIQINICLMATTKKKKKERIYYTQIAFAIL
jgi:hypothetical protein